MLRAHLTLSDAKLPKWDMLIKNAEKILKYSRTIEKIYIQKSPIMNMSD